MFSFSTNSRAVNTRNDVELISIVPTGCFMNLQQVWMSGRDSHCFISNVLGLFCVSDVFFINMIIIPCFLSPQTVAPSTQEMMSSSFESFQPDASWTYNRFECPGVIPIVSYRMCWVCFVFATCFLINMIIIPCFLSPRTVAPSTQEMMSSSFESFQPDAS
jgi:hypothetical protein